MSQIKDNIKEYQNKLGKGTTLVAVSKTKPSDIIMEAYEAGQRHFGENKVQELVSKAETLPKDIFWHMIGHLQRNKVKYIAPFVHLIHSVDSLRLIREINKQGKKSDRIINCLLQVHISKEDTKFGWDEAELLDVINGGELEELTHVQITGLMGMATNTTDSTVVSAEFKQLRSLFEFLSASDSSKMKMENLSIGMSNDYMIALENGSNMVRIGSAIFGERK